MSILNVSCCKVLKVISILSRFDTWPGFNHWMSNLLKSKLFLFAHYKLSAAMMLVFFFYGRFLSKSAPTGQSWKCCERGQTCSLLDTLVGQIHMTSCLLKKSEPSQLGALYSRKCKRYSHLKGPIH